MLLFRSEQHIDRWCRQWKLPVGATLTLTQGWDLARLWYSDRLSPSWKPFSPDQAQAIFAGIGLTGDFWKLSSH